MTLQMLTGAPDSSVFDPNVIWDPQTKRFYYSAIDDTSNQLLVGFSKTASPSAPSDFCHYSLSQTAHLDMSLLGDSSSFILIGTYHYTSGPEVVWYDKPQTGTTCPSNLTSGSHLTTRRRAGNPPVAVREVDARSTGYIMWANGESGSTLTVSARDSKHTGTPAFGTEKDDHRAAPSLGVVRTASGGTQLIGV